MIHEIFRRVAAEGPQRVALVHRAHEWTYGDLDARSDRVAAALLHLGVRPGSTVAIAVPRSFEAVTCILGTLKAGAAYMPLELAFPTDRLALMINDAHTAAVVTTAAQRERFPSHLPTLLLEQADSAPAPQLCDPGDGASLAYVMYTSGSTGVPKGIEICHDSVLRLVIDAKYVSLGPDCVVMQAAPLGFDASSFELWAPLLNGGVCVIHDEDLPTAAGLRSTIEKHRVTTAWLTAALFNAVVDDDPTHLAALKELLIGGEALSVPHVRRFLAAAPAVMLINGYGPTECTTFATTFRIPADLPAEARAVPIGRPITDTEAYILGPSMELLEPGQVGELYLGGRGLARGYLGQPELTNERFVANPFDQRGERLYRTGDLASCTADGIIEFVGRLDDQVKIRGFRIEPAEIEAQLAAHAGIKACAVVPEKLANGTHRLIAYAIARDQPVPLEQMRAHLAARLPDFMVPATYVWLDALPRTVNGKVDRRALPPPPIERPDLIQPYTEPVGEIEARVCAAFATELGIERVGRFDNFFDLGGDSLLVLKVLGRLPDPDRSGLSTNLFFREPTPEAIARAIVDRTESVVESRRLARSRKGPAPSDEPVAIIAMAGRFPGATTVEEFWRNLRDGRETITSFEDSELDPSLPPALTADPAYVKRRGVIADVERFDSTFFGISAREAEVMDPQHRVFLELCWECLERGGHAPDRARMPIGIFAGMYNATYYQKHVLYHPDRIEKLGEFQVMLANEKDYIATRVASRLNLTGPAVSVHTACSTSLVAIAQAFAALRSHQCDMALAGGVAITCPPRSGYLYQEGAMLSPDGRTRPFDAAAQGTVFSDGAAVVLLKRLGDAVADGDMVYAVIRGLAVNNDGRDKASFTAPSISGQAAGIAAAYEAAGINPRTVSYIEAHGTATPLGDPVEIEALTRAFRRTTPDRGFCRIGSVKSNVGHLVTAAGAAGVIKTALALSHEMLPPSVNFEKPNQAIDFATSPFLVNTALTPWPRAKEPRRAGVSSFGVGGTNVHLVLEEGPHRPEVGPSTSPELLLLSARTPSALGTMAAQLAEHLKAHPNTNLADVAYTLREGRSRFPERLALVAGSVDAAIDVLSEPTHRHRVSRSLGATIPPLIWLFPGQGAQYAGMGRGLHDGDRTFRDALDEAAESASKHAGFDLLARMFSGDANALTGTATTQPATFCLEYALARTLEARDVRPAALIGHSVGEFVAAVVAGVMSLQDAARLVAFRGRLMQDLPAGSMLSVRLPADPLSSRLPARLCVAAENGPSASVVSGPTVDVNAFRDVLEAEGVMTRLLQTSHAFHSSMMDGAVAPFNCEVETAHLRAPQVPIISTLTGTWLTASDAIDPGYWGRHLREPVRFSGAVRNCIARHEDAAFVELGPRDTLSTLVRQHGGRRPGSIAVPCMADSPELETSQLLLALGELWTAGIEASEPATSASNLRHRIVLPTYPFERQRLWLDPPSAKSAIPHVSDAMVSISASIGNPVVPTADPDGSARLGQERTVSEPTKAPSALPIPGLIAELRGFFEDISGLDLSEADESVSFIELGLDSLVLTQAAAMLKKRFKVPITFRELMEQYRNLRDLAGHLNRLMPMEPVTAVAAVAASQGPEPGSSEALSAGPAAAQFANDQGESPIQQVIRQQMELMSQQLALLASVSLDRPSQIGSGTGRPSLAAAGSEAQPAATVPHSMRTADDLRQVRYDVKKAFGAIARIHTEANALTDRQKARFDAFVKRYVAKTVQSKAYASEHRGHLADPRTVNGFRPITKEITYQIVMERSQGARMWDVDGNEYVDALNGFGVNLFGWRPDFVTDAIRSQLDTGYDIGPQHPLAGEVARLVCEMTGFDRAALCNTGSEAVMAAIRIARTVTGRSTVVLFAGSYHGTFDEVVVRGGRGGKAIPGAPGIMAGMFGDVRVLEYGSPEALEYIHAHADDLAAVLVEPVQSRRPEFQPVEFLKQLRAATQRCGVCLIFDEVITGFRLHQGGVQAMFGVNADLASYGKVIGGGMPIGVVAGRRDFMDALDGGSWQFGDDSIPTVGVTYFAGTFVRHPLALAAAKATLVHLKAAGGTLQTTLNRTTETMVRELNAFCKRVGAPISVSHCGSLWRVAWLEDHPFQDLLFAMMRSRGVHILDNFPCFMTTAHGAGEVDVMVSAFKNSIAELQEGGFLPTRVEPTEAMDRSRPPVADARLCRDNEGKPAWFVPDGKAPSKYSKYDPAKVAAKA